MRIGRPARPTGRLAQPRGPLSRLLSAQAQVHAPNVDQTWADAAAVAAAASRAPAEVVTNSKELGELLGKLLNDKDLTQLARQLSMMQKVSSTRLLVVSRIATQERPELRWVSMWLWPILKGTKSSAEAFPLSVPPSIYSKELVDGAADRLYHALWATNHTRRTLFLSPADAPADAPAATAAAAAAPSLDDLQASTRALAWRIVKDNPLPVAERLAGFLTKTASAEALPQRPALTAQLADILSPLGDHAAVQGVLANVGYAPLPTKSASSLRAAAASAAASAAPSSLSSPSLLSAADAEAAAATASATAATVKAKRELRQRQKQRLRLNAELAGALDGLLGVVDVWNAADRRAEQGLPPTARGLAAALASAQLRAGGAESVAPAASHAAAAAAALEEEELGHGLGHGQGNERTQGYASTDASANDKSKEKDKDSKDKAAAEQRSSRYYQKHTLFVTLRARRLDPDELGADPRGRGYGHGYGFGLGLLDAHAHADADADAEGAHGGADASSSTSSNTSSSGSSGSGVSSVVVEAVESVAETSRLFGFSDRYTGEPLVHNAEAEGALLEAEGGPAGPGAAAAAAAAVSGAGAWEGARDKLLAAFDVPVSDHATSSSSSSSSPSSSSSSSSAMTAEAAVEAVEATAAALSQASSPGLEDDPDAREFASYHRKIFLPNVPAQADEMDVARALRNCGAVDRVWLYRVAHKDGEGEGEREGEGDAEDDAPTAEEVEAEDRALAMRQKRRKGGSGNDDGPPPLSAVLDELISGDSDVHGDASADLSPSSLADSASSAGAGADTGKSGALRDEARRISQSYQLRVKDAQRERQSASKARAAKARAAKARAASGESDEEEGEDEDEEDGEGLLDLAIGFVPGAKGRKIQIPAASPGSGSDPAALASPLAPFVARSRASRRKLTTTQRDDSHAFVLFRDDASFRNATRDDMRVFGVQMQSNVCRVYETRRVRTLIVELLQIMTLKEAEQHLGAVLGVDFEFTARGSSLQVPGAGTARERARDGSKQADYVAALAGAKPIFIHLEFPTHAAAWEAMFALQKGAAGGAPLRPSWIKTQWYKEVANKARQIAAREGGLLERSERSGRAGRKLAEDGTAAATMAAAGADATVAVAVAVAGGATSKGGSRFRIRHRT